MEPIKKLQHITIADRKMEFSPMRNDQESDNTETSEGENYWRLGEVETSPRDSLEQRVTRVYDPGGNVCEEEMKNIEQQDKYIQQHEENNNDNDNQLTEEEPSIENINLKKMEEWSEEELNMIEEINDNIAGVANFVVNLLKHELNDISNDVKHHKRMYKNGYTKQKGKAGIVIHDILFDTGASHASYVSKDLVDLHRDMLKDNI